VITATLTTNWTQLGTLARANAGAPSVLISYSAADTDAIAASGIPGALTPIEGCGT